MKKNKILKVIEWLDCGIYPGTIMFSCGFEYDELIATLKRKRAKQWWYGLNDQKVLIDSGNCFALNRQVNLNDGNGFVNLFYIIITRQFDFSDKDFCVLAHECLHICQFHLPNILDRNREYESEAYLHTHIMQQCLKALRG